jgi:tetratricopeptide (TPR) repeat protein
MRIQQIESNHFDRQTEFLVKPKTGSLGGDIDFLLRYVPNHPRALASLSRLALKENRPKPSGASIPVECHFLRALAFAPDDPAVLMLYGSFLARTDRPKEALARLREAEKLETHNGTLQYNIGLVLVDLGDYPAARDYAEKAYAQGISLPGLRDRLAQKGYWKQ